MRISEQGISLIRRCEGFSAEAYYCPAGKLTIGYGHVIQPHESNLKPGISRDKAESLLWQDIQGTERAIARLVAVSLTQSQCDALIVFAYNIGIKAFEKSTLLRLLNAGDYSAAANEFPRWVYANGVKLEGLVKRRVEEQALFRASSEITTQ